MTKANSSAPLRRITLPPRAVHSLRQINIIGASVVASRAAVFLPAPRVMTKYETPMKLNPRENKFSQEPAIAGMVGVRMAEPANKGACGKDTSARAMTATRDQARSLSISKTKGNSHVS